MEIRTYEVDIDGIIPTQNGAGFELAEEFTDVLPTADVGFTFNATKWLSTRAFYALNVNLSDQDAIQLLSGPTDEFSRDYVQHAFGVSATVKY